MSSQLIDPTTYPISKVTARHLGRPLFGHVIDGGVVPSLDGATMPVIDPASGQQIAVAAAGSQADVERRCAPRARRSMTAAGASWRRWRRSAGCAGSLHCWPNVATCSASLMCSTPACCGGTRRSSSRRRLARSSISRLAVEGGGHDPGGPAEFAVYDLREPIGVVGLITPGTARRSCSGSSPERSPPETRW